MGVLSTGLIELLSIDCFCSCFRFLLKEASLTNIKAADLKAMLGSFNFKFCLLLP